MTNQEAFDVMVRHLRRQGCKSQDDERQTCLYRGPNGLKCAVGALIPDEEYREAWDEKGTSAANLQCASLAGIDQSLLCHMQQTHDHFPVSAWESRFHGIANDFNLTLPPLESEATNA